MPVHRSPCRVSSAIALAVLSVGSASRAAIISTGDVKPPFALIDTVGSTKAFTVPVDPSSTNGGVYVGDVNPGTLTLDNGWTLNATFGIVANGPGSSNTGASQLLIKDASVWNLSLDLDVGNDATGSAAIRTGSALNARTVRVGTLGGSSGNLEVSTSSTLTSTGATYVGIAGGATLTVAGNSTLNAGFVVVGDDFGSAGFATFSAGTLHSPGGGIRVGGRGLGQIDLINASSATALFTSIGEDPDSPGVSGVAPLDNAVNLSGPGTTYSNTEGFIVGYNTRGSLSMQNAASLDTGYLEVSRYGTDGSLTLASGAHLTVRPGGGITVPSVILATAAGSVATASIHDAGTRIDATGNGAYFEVARGGSATLGLSGGAAIASGYVLVATDANSDGSAAVADAGTTWSATDSIEVGRGGTGFMSVQNGASVSAANFLIVGSNVGATGTLIVTGQSGSIGPRSSFTAAAQAVLGIHGAGAVLVDGGARLQTLKSASPSSSSAILAQFSDGTGSATVSGANSVWEGDGGFNVGFRGHGTLSITAGGRVESADGMIARLPGSVGSVSIVDANSRWVMSNALYVGGRPASGVSGDDGLAGPGGTATLAVGNGAFVSVGSGLHLFAGGTVDLSGGGSVSVANPAAAEPSTLHVYAAGTLFSGGLLKGNLRTVGTVAASVPSATAFDTTAITGTATLGGTLALSPAATLSLAPSQRLTLLSAGSVVGKFATLIGNRIDATHWLAVLYAPTFVSVGLAPPGDSSLDGAVGFSDLLTLAQHYGQAGPTIDWTVGDFDGSGSVNFADLLALAQRYGTSSSAATGAPSAAFFADWALAQSLVPEPTALTTIAGGAMITARVRRRCRRLVGVAYDRG